MMTALFRSARRASLVGRVASWFGSGFSAAFLGALGVLLATATMAQASEANLAIPDLHEGKFNIFGATISAWWLLFWGAFIIAGTLSISLYLRQQIYKLPAHKSMLDISEIIFQTCKTYLIQQGKFLLMLFALIACAMTYYFMALQDKEFSVVAKVLFFSVVGMGG